MMTISTKVIVVVSVIVVGVFNIHFEPQDFVAPCGNPVVKAHLHHEDDEDDEDDGDDDHRGEDGHNDDEPKMWKVTPCSLRSPQPLR